MRDRQGSPVAATVLGVLVLALAVAAAVVILGDLLEPPGQAPTTPAAPVEAATIATEQVAAPLPAPRRAAGRTGRDGSFAFAVRGVNCGGTTIGDGAQDASTGVFCLVTLRITNLGNEARTFDAWRQAAFDTRGGRHEPSSATAVAEGADAFLEGIQPGASVTGTVVFDVPAGTRLHQVELHDSGVSGGVRLRL